MFIIKNKEELLDFFLESKGELIKINRSSITAKRWMLNNDDLEEIWNELYIKLSKLKNVKPLTKSGYMGYFILMFNNFYRDVYNPRTKKNHWKILKEYEDVNLLCNVNEIENPEGRDGDFFKSDNKKIKLLINILQNIFSNDEIENILYWVSVDSKESGKIKFKEKNINLVKDILIGFERGEELKINEWRMLYKKLYKGNE